MSIVLTLKEQCSLGFTGRVNVLLRDNSQFVGEILIKEGLLVSARYNSASGLNSLYRIVFDDIESDNKLKTIVEPEIVDSASIQFQIEFSSFKKEAEKKINTHRDSKSLRPPDNLILKIKPDFIKNGEQLSLNEFEILCTLVGKRTVGELYDSSPLLESEITKGLVSLRRKNAFLVKKNN